MIHNTKKSRGLLLVICMLLTSLLSAQEGGILLSFDDQNNISNWMKALPLFEKYGAVATFFINKPDQLTEEQIANLQKLAEHGFAIGSHGVHHVRSIDYLTKNGEEQFFEAEILAAHQSLEEAGLYPRSFAYPMSQRNEETDKILKRCYTHIRAGAPIPAGKTMAESDIYFTHVSNLPKTLVMTGKGCDHTDDIFVKEQIIPALKRAKEKKEILTLYAHNIAETGKGHYITPKILEQILQEASEIGLRFYTFDELELWKNPGTIRILSYNVQGCKGLNKDRVEYEMTGEIINKIAPDLAGVQEIDYKNDRSDKKDQLEILGNITGLKPEFAKAIDFMGGEYGVGVLTSENPLSIKKIPLPGKEEPRVLIEAEFEKFILFNTHLSLTSESRKEAAEIINEETRLYTKPIFMTGDLNISDQNEIAELFSSKWRVLSPSKETYPADKPAEQLDYIMVTDPTGNIPVHSEIWTNCVENSGVYHSRASDHRPVFVDIKLP